MENVKEEKKSNPLQLLNSLLMGLVAILLTLTFNSVSEIKNDVSKIKEAQSIQAAEIRVLQTEKEVNKTNIGNLHSRVFDLEINNAEKMKTWVDSNYKRKDQK
jgi:hypothetical protein